MLNNLINNLHKMGASSKESYFGKRWGASTAFEKQFSRDDYSFNELDKTAPSRQLKDQILTAYQNQPSEDARLFVNKVRDQSLSFLAERRGVRMQQMQKLAKLNESMTVVVRRIFDVLECFSLELNCYMGCTELQTSLTRPQHVREITKFSKARQPLETITYFRSRLATPSWSLVLRGKDDKIELFLIPVGKVMGLSKSEASYEPLFTLEAEIRDGEEVVWSINKKPLTEMREHELCMDLFTRLIDTTKHQLEVDGAYDEYAYR